MKIFLLMMGAAAATAPNKKKRRRMLTIGDVLTGRCQAGPELTA
jgi:hypothetical protein